MSIPLKIQALHLNYLALIETKLIAKQSRKPTLLASSLLLLAILSSAGRVVRAQTPPPGTSSQAQGAVTSPAPAKTPSPGGAGGRFEYLYDRPERCPVHSRLERG